MNRAFRSSLTLIPTPLFLRSKEEKFKPNRNLQTISFNTMYNMSMSCHGFSNERWGEGAPWTTFLSYSVKCVYSILTTNSLIFCCKKRSLRKISPLPSELSTMPFVRANIFHPQWMIISRLGVRVEFSVASNKNWFQWTFLRIFYHMVNDSILEIDSNSSNYSIPVDFTGRPEENLILYHQPGRSHCLTWSWRKKIFFIQGKAQTVEILLTGKLFPSETNLHSWSSWHVITLCVIWRCTKFFDYWFNLPNNGHNGSVQTSIHSVQNKTTF